MATNKTELSAELQEIMAAGRAAIARPLEDDPEALNSILYHLWQIHCDFTLYVHSPVLPSINPPIVHQPSIVPSTNKLEHVYRIVDSGFSLSTSKGDDAYVSGLSMCRMFNTIEKMVAILIERLKESGIDGTDTETQVEIAFVGHEVAQRKCFESVINYPGNIVVTNFDPGAWGERYLDMVAAFAKQGFGYPRTTPRWGEQGPLPASPAA